MSAEIGVSTMPDTKIDIAELRGLLEKAQKHLAPGKWSAHNYSTWINAPGLKGDDTHVADVRGWGYLTGHGHGALKLGDDEALAQQAAWGELIVAAVNALPSCLDQLEQSQREVERLGKPFTMLVDGDWLARRTADDPDADVEASSPDTLIELLKQERDEWRIKANSLEASLKRVAGEHEASQARVAELTAEVARLEGARPDEVSALVKMLRVRAIEAEALLQRAREGLERARKVFIRYADLHRAKRSEDGDLKALANLNEASAITDLLAAIQPGDSHE